jgi:hypothetical protein
MLPWKSNRISIKYYECVCILASVIRQAKRIFSTQHIWSCVACLILPNVSISTIYRVFPASYYVLSYLSTLSHKRQDFRKKIIEHKIWGLIFSTNLCETSLILRRIQRDIIVHKSSCKVPVILSDFNETLTF